MKGWVRLATPHRLVGYVAWRAMSGPDHSTLSLAVRMTLAHFSTSSAMNFPNPAGVIGIGSTPNSASRAFNLGSPSAALISPLSLSTIAEGVPLGALKPYHWLPS